MVVWFPIIRSQIKSGVQEIKGRIAGSRLAQTRVVVLAWQVQRKMSEDDATDMAAGVAYYTFLSLFPLLLALLAIAGLVLKSEGLQRQFLALVTDNLPGSADFIEKSLNEIIRFRGAIGIGAIVGLLWSASAAFGAIARVVNRAYDAHRTRTFYSAKPRQIGMALAVFVLFILSTSAISAIQLNTEDLGIPGQGILIKLGVARVALRVIPWLMSFGIFVLIYKFLPDCKTNWRYIWPGAAVAAVLFEIARSLFVWYLARFANYNVLYGPLASVIALLVWIYLSSLILILGAEISSGYQKVHQPEARGQ